MSVLPHRCADRIVMDPFTQRMIERANKRTTASEHLKICSSAHSGEIGSINHKETTTPVNAGRELQASCSAEDRVGIRTSAHFESIPIRSPRSSMFNDATFKNSAELDLMNRSHSCDGEKSDVHHGEQCAGKSRLNNELSTEDSTKETHDSSFSPTVQSSQVVGLRDVSNSIKKGQTEVCDEPRNKNNVNTKLDGMNGMIFHQRNPIALDGPIRSVPHERDRNLMDENSHSSTKEMIETEIRNVNCCRGTGNRTKASDLNGNVVKTENQDVIWFGLDFSKQPTLHSTASSRCTGKMDDIVSAAKNKEVSLQDEGMNGQMTYNKNPASKLSLEKIDDKEVCLSQLDEIDVSAMKIKGLEVSGLKSSQAITEKLPLPYIQDLPESSLLKNFIHQNGYNRQKSLGLTPAIKISEVSEENGSKVSGQPSCATMGISHSPKIMEESILANEKDCFIKESDSLSMKNNDSDLENSFVTSNSECISSEDDDEGNTPTDMSHDNLSVYSLHSSDFSFSCSCSTLVNEPSFPQEMPSDSLPYLLLQSLNRGKKARNKSFQSCDVERSTSIGNVLNRDFNYGDTEQTEAGSNHSLQESTLSMLRKKADIEGMIAEQASKALNLCYSSPVFSESPEQLEGERLLLLSTMRKQAILGEMQSFINRMPMPCFRNEDIEVKIDEIKLILRDEFLNLFSTPQQHEKFYFVCLISHRDTVLSTDVAEARKDQMHIKFRTRNLNIVAEWGDDFQFNFQVYMLRVKQARAEKTKGKHQKKDTESYLRKHKATKHEPHCLLTCGKAEFEYGGNASNYDLYRGLNLRVPSFTLSASTELRLPHDLQHHQFSLRLYENNHEEEYYVTPLHENVHLKIKCAFPPKTSQTAMDKSIFIKYKGFLTKFGLISGVGAWQRGWWCIKGTYLVSWKYPEDEENSPPLTVLDLKLCQDKVSPLSRLKCARSNTFSLKMKVDGNSYTEETEITQFRTPNSSTSGSITEHILSADTREEREDWCTHLNNILASLQSWRIINPVL